jgi:hypothetical protein
MTSDTVHRTRFSDSVAWPFALAAIGWLLASCGGDDSSDNGGDGDGVADAGREIDSGPEGVELPDGGPLCFHCGDIMTMPDEFDPANLCEESQPLFEALFACLCGTPEDPASASCGEECGDNACAGMNPSDACGNCAALDCGPETGMCLNDN